MTNTKRRDLLVIPAIILAVCAVIGMFFTSLAISLSIGLAIFVIYCFVLMALDKYPYAEVTAPLICIVLLIGILIFLAFNMAFLPNGWKDVKTWWDSKTIVIESDNDVYIDASAADDIYINATAGDDVEATIKAEDDATINNYVGGNAVINTQVDGDAEIDIDVGGNAEISINEWEGIQIEVGEGYTGNIDGEYATVTFTVRYLLDEKPAASIFFNGETAPKPSKSGGSAGLFFDNYEIRISPSEYKAGTYPIEVRINGEVAKKSALTIS